MPPPRHDPPFAAFLGPAMARPQLWRLLAGLVLIAVVHLALLGVVALVLSGLGAPRPEPRALSESPGLTVLLLFGFSGILLGVWLAARLFHRRGLGSLIGPRKTALWGFAVGVGAIAAVQLTLAIVVFGIVAPGPEPGLARGLWLMWLLPALAGLMVQTLAEELLFRGYLQQQLAARFASPLVWMVLPSVAFGVLHFEPGLMGENAWIVVVATGLFGLAAADLTARSGALGMAWGLHMANNTLAILIVSAHGDLSGLALWRLPAALEDPALMRRLLMLDIAGLGAAWAICRLVLSRR